MALVIKTIPIWKIVWTKIIKGKNKMYGLKPIPLNIKNKKIIKQEMIKFTKLLPTIEIGKISLGKYTFLIILPFCSTVVVPWLMVVTKKFHGKIPIIKNVT